METRPNTRVQSGIKPMSLLPGQETLPTHPIGNLKYFYDIKNDIFLVFGKLNAFGSLIPENSRER